MKTYAFTKPSFQTIKGFVLLIIILFAFPNTIQADTPPAPNALSATSIESNSFIANWELSTGATNYYIDVSTSSDFSTFVSQYQDFETGNVNSLSITGLTHVTTYYYRIRAYNTSGTSSNSNIITVSTTKLNQSITFSTLANKTYGDNNFSLTASASSGLTVTYQSSNTNVATISGNTLTIINAGSTTIKASQSGNSDYFPASDIEQIQVVNKKTITATANDESREECAPNPDLSISYSGFVSDDNADSLNTKPTTSCSATSGSPVGDYEISVSGGLDNNYNITNISGYLSITVDITNPNISSKNISINLDNNNVAGSIGSSNALFSEGFEYNNINDKIAWPQNNKWNTLDSLESESATVSNIKTNGGSKSLKITGDNNIILKLGEKTSGKYLVKWKSYIPTGASAQMFFSQDTSSNNDILGLAFFNGQALYIKSITNTFLGQYPFSHDTWFDVVAYFDLDNNRVLVLVDGTVRMDFSDQDYNLGAINFLEGGDGFYIDDIEYQDLSLSNTASTFVSNSDNCEVLASYADPLFFDCSSLGSNTVILTAIDKQGNIGSCQSTVTVVDRENPATPTITNVTGECSATATPPTTTDNCAGTITGTTTDPLTYSTQGTHIINWTFDDGNGNSISVNQNVIISDISKPIPDIGNLQNDTAECSGTLATPTATDNCDGTIYASTTCTFPVTETTTVTWTFTDAAGNSENQTQTIVIIDETAPVANTDSLSEITAEGSVTPDTPTATDNCDGAIDGTCSTEFPITSSMTITWIYTDTKGNQSSQNQSIVIVENSAPVANNSFLPGLIEECSVTPDIPTATDNLDGVITATTSTEFPITESTNITWVYTDAAGNSTTQNQEVTIYDDISPDIFCPQDIEYQLEDTNSTSYLVYKNEVQYLSCTDNCGIESIISNLNFSDSDSTAFSIGNNSVKWIAIDVHENQSSCSFNVLVKEPLILSTNITSLNNDNHLLLYPNPNNGNFTIKYESKSIGKGTLKITDITGRQIYSEVINKTTFDFNKKIELSNYSKGIYNLILELNNTIINKRIILK